MRSVPDKARRHRSGKIAPPRAAGGLAARGTPRPRDVRGLQRDITSCQLGIGTIRSDGSSCQPDVDKTSRRRTSSRRELGTIRNDRTSCLRNIDTTRNNRVRLQPDRAPPRAFVTRGAVACLRVRDRALGQ